MKFSRCVAGVLMLSLSAVVTFAAAAKNRSEQEWKQLANLPDPEGFASAFAGVSNDALLVAGGANFPGKRPWDGGTKVWYDSVFVLESPTGAWREAGKLPRLTAYGVSFTTTAGVVCAGGGDAKEHFRDVTLLSWEKNQLRMKALPSLPTPRAFASGATVGEKLYLFGGIARPDATTASANLWTLDLTAKTPAWQELPPCPGEPRMLAQVGAVGEKFYVCGGVSLHAGIDGKPVRTYLRDAYVYEPAKGWRRLADMPNSVAAAPSPMPASRNGELFVISGDDGSRAQLTGPNHPGFLQDVLVYNPKNDQWRKEKDAPISRATAPTSPWRDGWIVASGERKPGYRSPEIWWLKITP